MEEFEYTGGIRVTVLGWNARVTRIRGELGKFDTNSKFGTNNKCP